MATINLTPNSSRPVSVESADLPPGLTLSIGEDGESIKLSGSSENPIDGEFEYSVTAANGSVAVGSIKLAITAP